MNVFSARLVALFLALVSASAAAAPEIIQPRTFGYLLGDVLEQRVRLDGEPQAFVPVQLPSTGRVNLGLMRRSVGQERDAQGRNWLVLRYQIVNAPQELATWQIPAVKLSSETGNGTLDIPAWSFSVSPFTSPDQVQKRGMSALRPDHVSAAVDMAPYDRRITISLGLLLATLLAWGGWVAWRVINRGRQLPFARAWRDVRRLPESEPSGWRRLQHALNDAAGQVVRLNTLDRLIARVPYLAAERAALEQFCKEANALFFSRSAAANRISVRELARRLHLLERRHAR